MTHINILNGVKITCRDCKLEKPLHEFTEHRRFNLKSMAGVHSFSRERLCKPCGTAINIASMLRIKALVIAGYGGKCACCGLTELAFLCLDHVVPCGSENRGNCQSAWRDALRRRFPSDYQLLCYNCNNAKAFYPGGCPHQKHGGTLHQCPSQGFRSTLTAHYI